MKCQPSLESEPGHAMPAARQWAEEEQRDHGRGRHAAAATSVMNRAPGIAAIVAMRSIAFLSGW